MKQEEEEQKRKVGQTSEEVESRRRQHEKEPHWFSVGMCKLRRTKRLQHLICDILL